MINLSKRFPACVVANTSTINVAINFVDEYFKLLHVYPEKEQSALTIPEQSLQKLTIPENSIALTKFIEIEDEGVYSGTMIDGKRSGFGRMRYYNDYST